MYEIYYELQYLEDGNYKTILKSKFKKDIVERFKFISSQTPGYYKVVMFMTFDVIDQNTAFDDAYIIGVMS